MTVLKNITLQKVLFWAGLACAGFAAGCGLSGTDDASAGIPIGIAALAFLKASELLK